MAELQQSQLSEVLKRAQEIEAQTGQLDEEHQQLIRAAEEAGLSRDATIQALRERLTVPAQSFKEGTLVFAKSGDGFCYAARLQSIDGAFAAVRFLNGGESNVPLADLRMFSITPGTKLMYMYPSWGWVDGEVTRYNSETLSVTISYWGTETSLPLDKVRMPKEKKPAEIVSQSKIWMYTIGAGLAGTALGMLLLRFLQGL